MADYGCYISTDTNVVTTVWIPDGSGYYYYYPHDGPYQRQEPPTVDRFAPWGTRAPFEGHGPCRAEQDEEKEESEMVDRQTFLDALVIEGRQVTAEELEIVRDASDGKWRLLVAILLARAFETSDLALLKEKPKEVVVLVEK